MQNHRQVPPVAHLRQSISRDKLPPVQSPLSFGQQPQPQAPEQSISEQVQDLALGIYSQLAVAHIQHNQSTDRETLQALAASAQLAAMAYFEMMGVKFNEEGSTNG